MADDYGYQRLDDATTNTPERFQLTTISTFVDKGVPESVELRWGRTKFDADFQTVGNDYGKVGCFAVTSGTLQIDLTAIRGEVRHYKSDGSAITPLTSGDVPADGYVRITVGPGQLAMIADASFDAKAIGGPVEAIVFGNAFVGDPSPCPGSCWLP
jgi:hypothetical protein